MTQLLSGHTAAKYFTQDVSLVTFQFLYINILFLSHNSEFCFFFLKTGSFCTGVNTDCFVVSMLSAPRLTRSTRLGVTSCSCSQLCWWRPPLRPRAMARSHPAATKLRKDQPPKPSRAWSIHTTRRRPLPPARKAESLRSRRPTTLSTPFKTRRAAPTLASRRVVRATTRLAPTMC